MLSPLGPSPSQVLTTATSRLRSAFTAGPALARMQPSDQRALGGRIVLRRITSRPGAPTTYKRLPESASSDLSRKSNDLRRRLPRHYVQGARTSED